MPKAFPLVLLLCAFSLAQTTQPLAPIVELRGDGAAIGQMHGQALGEQVRGLSKAFLSKAIDPAAYPAVLDAAMAFEPQLWSEHLTEIRPLAISSNLD